MIVNAFLILLCVWWIVYPQGMVRAMGRQTGGASNVVSETAWRLSGVVMLLIMVVIWVIAAYRGTWPKS